MNACTIVAVNYLAHARVLAESFFEHHPEGSFTVLSLDDLTDVLEPRDGFDVLYLDDVGISPTELSTMRMIYNIVELSTAVKPFLLRTLLQGREDIVYLDPDIRIFRSLEDISVLARQHGIVLTPHSTRPFPRDGRRPAETDIMVSGIYNLGFCAIGQQGIAFLDWWAGRLARDCVIRPQDGLFVDQKWVDWAPSLFDPYILKDTSVNIAYWNLFGRSLEIDGPGYTVDGEPLGFFHFSGFDAEQPSKLSKHQDRIDVSSDPALVRICREYADAMIEAGYSELRHTATSVDRLPDGTRLDDAMRRAYRDALVRAETSALEGPPGAPRTADEADHFLSWLNEPIRRRGPARHVSRYLEAFQQGREDLRRAFPDMGRRTDVTRYLEWVRSEGAASAGMPVRLAPEGSRPAPAPSGPSGPPIVQVAGYLRAELGVGETARGIVAGLEAAGIPCQTYTYAKTLSRQGHRFDDQVADAGEPDINIVVVNADALPQFVADAGPEFFGNRYTIGLWAWEVGTFPSSMHESFSYVDEIWVPSDFVRDVIQRETVKPVRVVPLPLTPPPVGSVDLTSLGIPDDRYMFLFAFDFMSIVERKNPHGLIEAYTDAIQPDDGAVLVIKTINGDREPEALQTLRDAAKGRPDIVIYDGYLDPDEKHGLMNACDCYVSLHRSEGLGLTMAEAMFLGKPVIATGYSGNLHFMSSSDAYLVGYDLTRVPPGCGPYPVGSEWAQPDLGDASRLIRTVFDDPDAARATGRRAREAIEARMPVSRTGEFLTERIAHIREHALTSDRKPIKPRGPVTRAESFVRVGPEVSWEHGGSSAGKLFRRILRRLLKPYTVRQREFETAVVEALQDSLYSEVDLRGRLHVIEEQLEELLRRVPAVQPEVEGRGEAIGDTAARTPGG